MIKRNTIAFNEIGLDDVNLVGGKNASLGEMLQNISEMNIRVPNGYAITVNAYFNYLKDNNLEFKINELIEKIDYDDLDSLRVYSFKIRELIINGRFNDATQKEILEQYKILSEEYDVPNIDVAVRSSATAEDLPNASFAGQQDTYLNIRGKEALLTAIKNCFASLFTDRAISYRHTFGFTHMDIGLSVGIQKMVRSDLGMSGVAFSIDTESGFKDVVRINAAYGLGETVVQGSVSPDEYIVHKPTLAKGFDSVIEKKLGSKLIKMEYSNNSMQMTKVVPVNEKLQSQFCLLDKEILELSRWVVAIEHYYSKLKNAWCPMDVEWAYDGLDKKLYIVQARPETIHSRKNNSIFKSFEIDKNKETSVLTQGIAVGDGVGQGKVKILASLDSRDINASKTAFKKGDVLVTDMTDPDWEPLMKIASAIITNKGGRTCHAAIVAREMGIPAIVGTKNATDTLQDLQEVTVSCAEGDTGFVYEGKIAFKETNVDLNNYPLPSTPIMLNVASPDMAFKFAQLPNAGVGLAREEFIINNYIKAHPLALLKHKTLKDPELTQSIKKLTKGYKNEEEFFIEKLSNGVAKIAAAFYPNKVIVRFSDFKSNEYANLLGGKYFEPNEENPMIGWRGASRYYSKEYKEAFGLECKAIKRAREQYGLDNITVMIPFCRTVMECKRVLETMEEYGLKRGDNGLEVFLMAELPSNIILAEQFAEFVDGFSIGSNDLTQLTLGLDRDSSLVAFLYDERNDAVKMILKSLIKTAIRLKKKVGICGQGPSDFPDFSAFLVEQGINSISVTPDALLKTLNILNKIEDKTRKVVASS